MNGPNPPPTVAVAGATSRFGQILGDKLCQEVDLVGLTRRDLEDDTLPEAGWEWRQCDLYSQNSTARALEGVDHLVYLAHSARPSARLTQASPRDLDLLCADNVARAAETHELRSIVYLSTLLHSDSGNRSESRDELSRTFASCGVPVSTIETDLILTPGGTTAKTLRKLVERLPVLACPSWTRLPIRVASADELAETIVELLAEEGDNSAPSHRTVGATSTYESLLRQTAEILERRRPIVPLPFALTLLSAWWIAWFAGLPTYLMRQFVRQIRDEKRSLPEAPTDRVQSESLREALGFNSSSETRGTMIRRQEGRARYRGLIRRSPTVRSVQRLPLPDGRSAEWIAQEYVEWLDDSLGPLLRADVEPGPTVRFHVAGIGPPLLVLTADEASQSVDSYTFRISTGLLVAEAPNARFEFRTLRGANCAVAAIHDFRPALPWYVYRWSQAWLHAWVMARFHRHLERCDRSKANH